MFFFSLFVFWIHGLVYPCHNLRLIHKVGGVDPFQQLRKGRLAAPGELESGAHWAYVVSWGLNRC